MTPQTRRRTRHARQTLLALVPPLVALLLSGPAGADRRPFAPADEPRHYAPERRYDLEHLRLDLAFDWAEGRIAGTATNTVVPLRPGLDALVFHAAGLDVERVRLAGTAGDLPFAVDPAAETLTVRLGRPFGPQDRLEVAIDYSAKPRTGLYFVGPDDAYPDKPRQIWSQGEPELNRHWFPSWDYPNDRTTTELAATVAKPFTVVGNGRLVEVTDRPDGRRTFHWRMEQPHTTYLVSVVVSEFTRIADDWKGIPVEYYVPPGYEDKARRSFGKTPEMMEFFSTATGRPYPYAKYAQTTVADFMWGGMENVTATTQTLRTLHDERAAVDSPSDGLVAHELAHQWFGDLVTCEDWAHLWLNEAMADYMTALYFRHARGEDELAWELDDLRKDYLEEDAEEYRRPIVTYRYPDPIAMLDDHTYEKGALVLHMAHFLMGEEGWWKGLRAYVERFANQTVKTPDLQGVFEEVSGASLGELFDQYVYGAGHPELELRWDYQADRGLVRLEVRQTQEVDAQTGLFSFPVEIALVGDEATVVQRVPVRARAVQDLYLPSATRPRTVVFDPRGWILKTVDFDKPTEEWIVQLEAAGPAAATAARLEALRALGRLGDGRAVAALGRTLREAPFRGLRQVAAEALGDVRTEAALEALRGGIDDRDSRVRTAVFAALGQFPEHRELLSALRRALENDSSYAVRAAAAKSLGKFRDFSREVNPWLVRALSQDSHNEVVRAAAVEALAELEAPEALQHALRLARYGSPSESRDDAMSALARLGTRSSNPAVRERIRRTLESHLTDRDFRARQGAHDALAELGDPAAIPPLERAARAAAESMEARGHRRAIEEIREKAAQGDGLRLRVEQLEREVEVLKGQIEETKGSAGQRP